METTWDYSIPNHSPLLRYANSHDGSQRSNLDPAWKQSCSVRRGDVCYLSSAHTTNVFGASMSLVFFGECQGLTCACVFESLLILYFYVTKGQSIQLFGNVTKGMVYEVIVDGLVSTGVPSGRVLASLSHLQKGDHNVTLVAKPSAPGGAATLLFESAVVTVGTQLTG